MAVWVLPNVAAVIILFISSSASQLWRWRKLWGELSAAFTITGLVFSMVSQLDWPMIGLLVLLNLIALLLAARLLFGRLPDEFLYYSTRLNALGLSICFIVALLFSNLNIANLLFYALLTCIGVSLIVSVIFVYGAVWTLRHFRLRKLAVSLTPSELPTVSLAIPARNETSVLTDCLSAAVASDYPKLEILALDDCSQDKTSDLIRAFAHDGVRFIQGDQPDDGWLGKNLAFKTLATQASGDYILFSGVDTRLGPQSISKLVSYAVSNQLDMVAALPRRRDGPNLATLLWQLRYYWQIVLPITGHRVPVASQCWLIKASVLRKLGGFDAARNKIVVEGFFARRLFVRDGYRFIVSNKELGVTTAKRWNSQNETALRLLYPTFKRQPLYLLLGAAFIFGICLLPFGLSVGLAMVGKFDVVWVLSIIVSSFFLFGYALVIIRVMPRSWPLTLLFFPLSLTLEIILLVISMLAYEFGDVNWKGRNVCYPVLTTYHSPLASL